MSKSRSRWVINSDIPLFNYYSVLAEPKQSKKEPKAKTAEKEEQKTPVPTKEKKAASPTSQTQINRQLATEAMAVTLVSFARGAAGDHYECDRLHLGCKHTPIVFEARINGSVVLHQAAITYCPSLYDKMLGSVMPHLTRQVILSSVIDLFVNQKCAPLGRPVHCDSDCVGMGVAFPAHVGKYDFSSMMCMITDIARHNISIPCTYLYTSFVSGNSSLCGPLGNFSLPQPIKACFAKLGDFAIELTLHEREAWERGQEQPAPSGTNPLYIGTAIACAGAVTFFAGRQVYRWCKRGDSRGDFDALSMTERQPSPGPRYTASADD